MSKKTTMTVKGVTITEAQITECETWMSLGSFVAASLANHAENIGVPKAVSYRFADRLIQRHSGRNIKLVNRQWHWLGQTQEERKA